MSYETFVNPGRFGRPHQLKKDGRKTTLSKVPDNKNGGGIENA